MDRASACGAKGLKFDPYWAQVSVGGFIDSTHLFTPFSGDRVWFICIFQEKKTPSEPYLMRDTRSIIYHSIVRDGLSERRIREVGFLFWDRLLQRWSLTRIAKVVHIGPHYRSDMEFLS